MRSFISFLVLPSLVALAALHTAGCGPGACERIDEPCRSEELAPITALFGAERIDACTSAITARDDGRCAMLESECVDACTPPTAATELEITGCWEAEVVAGRRRVLCLGALFVPEAVVMAGNGDFAFALWEGAPGAETMLLSGEFEVMEPTERIHLYVDETPGEQLCTYIVSAGSYGFMTGELDRDCTGEEALTIGWSETARPR